MTKSIPQGIDYVVFASYGNDSVALIQWVYENELKGNVAVVYSSTDWARDDWMSRVEKMEDWVRSLGFNPCRTYSIGMESLVKKKKAWPRNGMQFCTLELKIRPAMQWLDEMDPEKRATCLVGVRREESLARKNFPERLAASPNHGDRTMWAPLVDVTGIERDALLVRAGVEPLPHRSMECSPCVNSSRRDIMLLEEKDISKVERIEKELGFTGKGKPRLMFRPEKFMGATGIREVIRWAKSERGKFRSETETDCESGFCAM